MSRCVPEPPSFTGAYEWHVKMIATFASLFRFHKTDYVYPNEKINDCWEKVLLNQCEFQSH